MKTQTLLLVIMMSWLSACTTLEDATTAPPLFHPASFEDLPGWSQDNLSDVHRALSKSCTRQQKIALSGAVKPVGTWEDWRVFCEELLAHDPTTDIRPFLERSLRPWRVTTRVRDDGLFTGYYEASLRGSRTRHGAYQTPIRARPLDHVVVNLGDFKPDLKGERITGQLTGLPGTRSLRPYPAREGIIRGEIPHTEDHVLAWVDDPVDAFFLEIQGSGRIAMDDGTTLHVGYDERNGHAYTAIGKVLVERGAMTKEQASMQSIRAWITAHPDQAQDLMNQNKSYIFFRDIGPDGPIGAENIALTPLRSLAIDKSMWSYGLPFYVDADAPEGTGPRLQRLMIGQDTGGAIKGAIRGDVFWGYGAEAAHTAGVMKSRGNLWVLLPAHLAPE